MENELPEEKSLTYSKKQRKSDVRSFYSVLRLLKKQDRRGLPLPAKAVAKQHEKESFIRRSAPIIISSIALMVSIFGTTYSIVKDKNEVFQKNRAEVRNIILQMIDLETSLSARDSLKPGKAFDSKMDVLLAAADNIQKNIPLALSREEYSTLSYMHGSYGSLGGEDEVLYYDTLVERTSKAGGELANAFRQEAIHLDIFNRLDKAIIAFNKAKETLVEAKSSSEWNELAGIHIDLAKLYLKQGNFKQSKLELAEAKSVIGNIRSDEWEVQRKIDLGRVEAELERQK